MLNNKGFTLVELMGVIAIMAIIIGIAVPSYIGITKSNNEHMYENKVTEIKIKAEEYANANNIDKATIPVSTLITEGYLEVDKPKNAIGSQIVNPVGGYMDCDMISISKNDGEYSIEVTDNDDCSQTGINQITSTIPLHVYKYENNTVGTQLDTDTDVLWSNSDVIIYADLSNVKDKLIDNKVTWKNSTNEEIKDKTIVDAVTSNAENASNEKKVSATLFLNAEYVVSVETTSGTVTSKINVKIDEEAPYVEAKANDTWSSGTKDININGSDGTGSGVDKFYIGTTATKPNVNEFNINSENNQAKESKDVGTYYVYAKDKAGNISEASKVEISNIDKTGPICKYAKVPTEFVYNGVTYPWSHEDVTLTYGCSTDSSSGCKTEDIKKTYNSHVNETISWEIEDNVGNKTECSQTVEIKIDKTVPTITANNNPISLGTQDYNFISNINVSYGESTGITVCNPASTKKTGSYNVTCTATGNNGVISSVTFGARHNYGASSYQKSYSYRCNCHQSCGCHCGHHSCDPWTHDHSRQYFGAMCCDCADSCSDECNTCSGSYTVYYCPAGGSLSGTTCYY